MFDHDLRKRRRRKARKGAKRPGLAAPSTSLRTGSDATRQEFAQKLPNFVLSMSEEQIMNKVAASGIITLDLEEIYPAGERVVFDLKPLLWQQVALKEDELRAYVKEHDWSGYNGKFVSIHCSADAIVPTWAFMLIAVALQPHAAFITQGDADELERAVFTRFVQQLDVEPYRGASVVVKGCSKLPVPLNAYVELSAKLLPVVRSLMFGEPCSTVPLYKVPKA